MNEITQMRDSLKTMALTAITHEDDSDERESLLFWYQQIDALLRLKEAHE